MAFHTVWPSLARHVILDPEKPNILFSSDIPAKIATCVADMHLFEGGATSRLVDLTQSIRSFNIVLELNALLVRVPSLAPSGFVRRNQIFVAKTTKPHHILAPPTLHDPRLLEVWGSVLRSACDGEVFVVSTTLVLEQLTVDLANVANIQIGFSQPLTVLVDHVNITDTIKEYICRKLRAELRNNSNLPADIANSSTILQELPVPMVSMRDFSSQQDESTLFDLTLDSEGVFEKLFDIGDDDFDVSADELRLLGSDDSGKCTANDDDDEFYADYANKIGSEMLSISTAFKIIERNLSAHAGNSQESFTFQEENTDREDGINSGKFHEYVQSLNPGEQLSLINSAETLHSNLKDIGPAYPDIGCLSLKANPEDNITFKKSLLQPALLQPMQELQPNPPNESMSGNTIQPDALFSQRESSISTSVSTFATKSESSTLSNGRANSMTMGLQESPTLCELNSSRDRANLEEPGFSSGSILVAETSTRTNSPAKSPKNQTNFSEFTPKPSGSPVRLAQTTSQSPTGKKTSIALITTEDNFGLEYAFRDQSTEVPSFIKQDKKFKFIKIGKVQKFVHMFEEQTEVEPKSNLGSRNSTRPASPLKTSS